MRVFTLLKTTKIWFLAIFLVAASFILPECLSPEANPSLFEAGIHAPTLKDFMLFGVYEYRNILYVVVISARLTLYLALISLLISAFAGLSLIFMDFVSPTRALIHPLLGITTYCPRLLILILLSAFLALSRPSQLSFGISFYLIVLLGATGAIFLASQTAGEITQLRRELYVRFAASLGLSSWTIFFRHVIPNCTSIPLTITKQFRDNILFLSTLSFIGLIHLQNPSDFGAIIFQYGNDPEVFQKAWWALFFPCATLAGFILLFDCLAERLARRLEKSPVIPKI